MNIQELSRRALNLSLAIYRVTAKFPAGEVLVAQMRELGNEVAATLGAAGDIENFEKKINRLRVYFQIAKAQNWVKSDNWSILDFEYYKLQQEAFLEYRELTRRGNIINKQEPEKDADIASHNIKTVKKTVQASDSQADRISSRQTEVLKAIQGNGSVKMSDLAPLLKNIASERTLRNDLQELVDKRLIKKEGSKRGARYFVKK